MSDIRRQNIKAILPLFVSHIVTAPKVNLWPFLKVNPLSCQTISESIVLLPVEFRKYYFLFITSYKPQEVSVFIHIVGVAFKKKM